MNNNRFIMTIGTIISIIILCIGIFFTLQAGELIPCLILITGIILLLISLITDYLNPYSKPEAIKITVDSKLSFTVSCIIFFNVE